MLGGITGKIQKQGNTEAGPVGKEESDCSFSCIQYTTINEYKSSIFKITSLVIIKKTRPQQVSRSMGQGCGGAIDAITLPLSVELTRPISRYAQLYRSLVARL